MVSFVHSSKGRNMIFSKGITTLPSNTYVPSLRWRRGEYQALHNLDGSIKNRIVPLIVIPEVEYDFEKQENKRSVHDHVQPFADRFYDNWGLLPAWIGIHPNMIENRMRDGRHIFSYVFEKLGWFGANAVPMISLESKLSTVEAVSTVVKKDEFGIGLSLTLEDLMVSSTLSKISFLLSKIQMDRSFVDLIVDLHAPNFSPYKVFSDLLLANLSKLDHFDGYRNFILVSTAMPDTLGKFTRGTHEVTRHDWLFYKTLLDNWKSRIRCPIFGDYTIVNPNFAPIDMRGIKSAAKLVYTTPSSWWIRKGSAFRVNRSQMHGHCRDLLSSGVFMGRAFSSGDSYIASCADELSSPSNHTKWKNVTINHHITQVVSDLDDLHGVP